MQVKEVYSLKIWESVSCFSLRELLRTEYRCSIVRQGNAKFKKVIIRMLKWKNWDEKIFYKKKQSLRIFKKDTYRLFKLKKNARTDFILLRAKSSENLWEYVRQHSH